MAKLKAECLQHYDVANVLPLRAKLRGNLNRSFFKQKAAYEIIVCLKFRRVLFRSDRKSTRLNSSNTRLSCDWSSDVCSSDLHPNLLAYHPHAVIVIGRSHTCSGSK